MTAARADAAGAADVVVTLVPEAWRVADLARTVGRTRGLVRSIVVVGRCGTRELRLVRGRHAARLAPVVRLLTSASAPTPRGRPLTLTDLPDGARLFDELASGRKVVVVELAAPGPTAQRRWLEVLAATAARGACGVGSRAARNTACAARRAG